MSVPRKKIAKKKAASRKAAPKTPRLGRGEEGAEEEGSGSPRPGTPPRPDQMDAEVVDFITAIEEYKRQHGRPFPNWSEILEVVKSLGYVRAR